MRKIKFRGKRKDDGEWVYGDLGQAVIEGKLLCFISIPTHGPTYEVDPKTIGQYTGFKDKNNKEIYEGDIVRVKRIRFTDCSKEKIEEVFEYFGAIEWFQHGWCVAQKTDHGKRIRNLFYCNLKDKEDDPDTEIFEALGNIYENSELLDNPNEETGSEENKG